MAQEEHQEQAVRHRPVSEAARSLSRWFERETDILERAIRIGREHLAGHPEDSVTRASVATLEQERRDLFAGWENSSVRRAVESRAEKKERPAAGRTEQRVAAAPESRQMPAEFRADTGTAATLTAKQLVGHAAVFNRWADIGYFREKIAPGAFGEVLKTSDVRFLFNHDPNFIYGRSTANTLELREDSVGLAFVCYLLGFDAASYALARRIDRRDISGCSFSFTVKRDEWKLPATPGGLDERTILQFDRLFDIAAVTYPAYPQTDVTATFEKVERPGRSAEPARPTRAPTPDMDYEELDRLDEQILAQHRRRPSASPAEVARLRREIILLRHYSKLPS